MWVTFQSVNNIIIPECEVLTSVINIITRQNVTVFDVGAKLLMLMTRLVTLLETCHQHIWSPTSVTKIDATFQVTMMRAIPFCFRSSGDISISSSNSGNLFKIFSYSRIFTISKPASSSIAHRFTNK